MSVSPKFFMFFFFVYAGAAAICMVIEGSYIDSQVGFTNNITHWTAVFQNTNIGLMGYINLGWEFLTEGIPTILLWKYSFITTSGFAYLQWLLIMIFDVPLLVTVCLVGKQLFSLFG